MNDRKVVHTMFIKVKKVVPKDNYIISIHFENGTTKIYDIKPLFTKYSQFDQLKYTKGLFEQVVVDAGGYGVSWNDELDIACDELWENGTVDVEKNVS